MIKNDEISLIVNTTEGKQAILESRSIRREAVARKVTYYTTLGGRVRDLRGDRPPAGGRGQPSAGSSQRSSCMSRKPLTHKGADKLRIELRRLKTEERPRVIQAIAEARAHGDLSENAEYHAAREQQGFIEGRIKRYRVRAFA